MIRNRSVPADSVLPHVVYRDVPRAVAWLGAHFGFSEHYRYGEPVSGAQMVLGNAWIMVHGERPQSASPSELGGRGTQALTRFVGGGEEHHPRGEAAAAPVGG